MQIWTEATADREWFIEMGRQVKFCRTNHTGIPDTKSTWWKWNKRKKQKKHITAVSSTIHDIWESLNTLNKPIKCCHDRNSYSRTLVENTYYILQELFSANTNAKPARTEKDTWVQLSNGSPTSSVETTSLLVIWSGTTAHFFLQVLIT